MNTKFLTGLVATTAAIATAFMGGTAEAQVTIDAQQNLQAIDQAFYNELVDDYLLRGLWKSEGVAISDPSLYALDGDIKAIGDSVDVFFIDVDPSYKAQALYDDTISFSVNSGAEYKAFNLDGSDRVDDSVDEVANGEGFTIGGLATGDILDFLLTSTNFNGTTNVFGADNNADGLQHIVAYEIEHGGFNWLYLGWEDILGGGDMDFNDAAIVLKGVAVSKDVPEPGITLALLGVAAGTMGLRRRKNAA
jgi:hypothetical protein